MELHGTDVHEDVSWVARALESCAGLAKSELLSLLGRVGCGRVGWQGASPDDPRRRCFGPLPLEGGSSSSFAKLSDLRDGTGDLRDSKPKTATLCRQAAPAARTVPWASILRQHGALEEKSTLTWRPGQEQVG